MIKLKESLSNGELVSIDLVNKFVENQMEQNLQAKGIILDGFPRDMDQALDFEIKVSNLCENVRKINAHMSWTVIHMIFKINVER